MKSPRILLYIFICAIAACAPSAGRAQVADHDFELGRQMDVFSEVYSKLDMHYVDTLPVRGFMERVIDYMLSSLDPYTVYYTEEHSDELRNFVSERYAGIGAGLYTLAGSRRTMITSVVRGGPAEAAGLHPGDVLMRIDNRELAPAASASASDRAHYTTEILSRLSGEPGSTVDIDVARPGQTRLKSFTLRRQAIEQKSVEYAAMVSDSVGYVYIGQFTAHTAHDLRAAIASLKARGAQRLILDLRDNPGGLLRAAVDVVGTFVARDTEVLRTRSKNRFSETTFVTDNEPIDELMPLVVLLDGGSASAAEIAGGALQDLDRAVIIGRRSFGKGLVQSTYDISYGGLLKVTTAKYYIPSGRCIQALDYSHRTPAGDPMPLPDSLSSEYLTSAGRTVRDGGGITPDITVPADTMPELVRLLAQSDVLYEFCAAYARAHRSISAPLVFELTESEFTDFKAAVITSGFEFGNHSRELLATLRTTAQAEGFGSDVDAKMAELYAQLEPDLDRALERWRRPVKRLVERQIVSTYYGSPGVVEYSLRGSQDVATAVELLRDERRYRSILSTAPQR
ncbi:MAG: S41 family peptidase [Bacteroidaceae bacterium]|nr:S41 family peptidase [Bacteroidaceae bacterium]